MNDWLILLPPLVAGLLVLLSHMPLGLQVLQREIVFIDLAIAQLAALGGVWAMQWEWTLLPVELTQMLGGIVLALTGTSLVAMICRYLPDYREALIGLLYALSASVLMVLLAYDPQGNRALLQSLNGDILWVSWSQIGWLALVTPVVWFVCRRPMATGFSPVFAVLVTISVPIMGIYLVFCSLIAPALVVRMLNGRQRWGWLTGLLGYLIGLFLSLLLDWPAGATLVLSVILVAVVVVVIGRFIQRSADDSTTVEASS